MAVSSQCAMTSGWLLPPTTRAFQKSVATQYLGARDQFGASPQRSFVAPHQNVLTTESVAATQHPGSQLPDAIRPSILMSQTQAWHPLQLIRRVVRADAQQNRCSRSEASRTAPDAARTIVTRSVDPSWLCTNLVAPGVVTTEWAP